MLAHIFRFSWRNVWRNKRRTYFTLFAIAVGVMSVIFVKSYMLGIINSGGEELIKTEIGHIKLAHREYLRLERIMPREYMIPDVTRLQNRIAAFPEVTLTVERIKFNVLLNHRDANEVGIAVGIAPSKADRCMSISRSIVKGRLYDGAGANLIIGRGLARKLGVGVDDEILLITTDINYSSYAMPFKVAGIFETGYSSMDKHAVYIPTESARKMLDCGDAAHDLLVFLRHPARAPQVGESISRMLSRLYPASGLQALPWQEHDFISGMMPYTKTFFDRVIGILMLIVALVILNTMLMTVMERYREIGVVKALGFKDREVICMIFIEASLIGTIGSALGGFLGGTMAAVLERVGIDLTAMIGKDLWEKIDIPVPMIRSVVHPDFNVSILIGSIIFGIFVTLVAVLYPAWKSLKMSPVDAFRSQLKV